MLNGTCKTHGRLDVQHCSWDASSSPKNKQWSGSKAAEGITCCILQEFKLKYLGPYMERLLRLAANETLREELAAFPLAPDADGGILPEHRAGALHEPHLSCPVPL